jgi:hypothetical protein
MDVSTLKDRLEALPEHHHLDVLRLIVECKASYNENQNGVFVNLSNAPPNLLQKLENYLDYAQLQWSTLEEGESQREEMKDQLSGAVDSKKS